MPFESKFDVRIFGHMNAVVITDITTPGYESKITMSLGDMLELIALWNESEQRGVKMNLEYDSVSINRNRNFAVIIDRHSGSIIMSLADVEYLHEILGRI